MLGERDAPLRTRISRTDAGQHLRRVRPPTSRALPCPPAGPARLPPASSSSARSSPRHGISIPGSRTASVAATARRIAAPGAGTSQGARRPPCSISRPPNLRPSCTRMIRVSCRAVELVPARVAHLGGDWRLEATMSVNSAAPIARPAVRRCVGPDALARPLERWRERCARGKRGQPACSRARIAAAAAAGLLPLVALE